MHKIVIVASLLFLPPMSPIGPSPKAVPHPGPEGIEVLLKEVFRAIDQGDRDALKRTIAGEEHAAKVMIWDTDGEHRPVTATGRAEAIAFIDALFDDLAKRKVTVKSQLRNVRADCHAPELGYATFEFDHAFTSGGRTDTFSYRGTVLASLAKEPKEGWRMFHWHSSLAKEPPARPATPAGAAEKR